MEEDEEEEEEEDWIDLIDLEDLDGLEDGTGFKPDNVFVLDLTIA